MNLLLLLLIFVASLITLVKASDFFTDAAEQVGLAMDFPPFIVGVTVVSIGTSLPELLSSLFGVFQGAPEVVVGNVVGSNVANICLVIGVAAIISAHSLRILYDLVSVDLPLFMGSALLFVLMAWDQTFSRGEALLLVIGYILYLFYVLKSSDDTDSEGKTSDDSPTTTASATQMSRQGLILVLSGIFIFLGANYTIDSLIQLSEVLNIGKGVIAVSAVALGTSLPELMVTINAARKGKAEIAIGNVLGSNIFNIFVVIGIPGLIQPLPVSEAVIIPGLPTLVAASLMTFFVAQDKKVTIWEGWLFILFYAWFVGSIFGLLWEMLWQSKGLTNLSTASRSHRIKDFSVRNCPYSNPHKGWAGLRVKERSLIKGIALLGGSGKVIEAVCDNAQLISAGTFRHSSSSITLLAEDCNFRAALCGRSTGWIARKPVADWPFGGGGVYHLSLLCEDDLASGC